MRILLDTHICLLWLQDSPKLSAHACEKIMSATEVYVSSASIWEASIKIRIGKLEADIDMLVEQAMCEPLRLLTADTQVARYSELVDLV